MNQAATQSSEKQDASSATDSQSFVKGLWGVRYQVKDVSRSIKFYTEQLGLKLDMQKGTLGIGPAEKPSVGGKFKKKVR